jgi:hypothetical protein
MTSVLEMDPFEESCGIVFVPGPDAVGRTRVAVADEVNRQKKFGPAAGDVVADVPALRMALRRDCAAVGYTGKIDEDVWPLLVTAALTGRIVFVPADEGVDEGRAVLDSLLAADSTRLPVSVLLD